MPTKEQLIRYLVDPKKLPPDVREAIRVAEAQAGSDVSKWFAEMDRKLANPLENIDWLHMMSPSKPVRAQKVKAASNPATYRRFLPWAGVIAASAAAAMFMFFQLEQINKRLAQFDGRLSGIASTEVRTSKFERLARHLYMQRYDQAEEVANEMWEDFPDTRDQLRNDITAIAEGLVAQGEPNSLLRFAERWPLRFKHPSGAPPMLGIFSDHALKAVAYNKLGDLKLAQSELMQYAATRTREQGVSKDLEAELIRVATAVGEYRLAIGFGQRFDLSDQPTPDEVKTGLYLVEAALKIDSYGTAESILNRLCENVGRMVRNNAAAVLRFATVDYVVLGNAEKSKWAFRKLKTDYQFEEQFNTVPSEARAVLEGIGNIVCDESAKASEVLELALKDETIPASTRALFYGLLSWSRQDEGKYELAIKAAEDSLAAASQADRKVQEDVAIAAGFLFCSTNEVEKAVVLVSKLKVDVKGRSEITEDMLDRIKILDARIAVAQGKLSEAINWLASVSPTSRLNEFAKSMIISINGGTLAAAPPKEQSALMSLLKISF